MQTPQTPLSGDNYRILIFLDAPDYFQGCSAIGTTYDEVYVGQGDTANNAYQDAIDQMLFHQPDGYEDPFGLPQTLDGYDDERLSNEEMAANEASDMEGHLYYYVAVYINYPLEPGHRVNTAAMKTQRTPGPLTINQELVAALTKALTLVEAAAAQYTADTGRHLPCYTKGDFNQITEALKKATGKEYNELTE